MGIIWSCSEADTFEVTDEVVEGCRIGKDLRISFINEEDIVWCFLKVQTEPEADLFLCNSSNSVKLLKIELISFEEVEVAVDQVHSGSDLSLEEQKGDCRGHSRLALASADSPQLSLKLLDQSYRELSQSKLKIVGFQLTEAVNSKPNHAVLQEIRSELPRKSGSVSQLEPIQLCLH
jgi:hypothetical protein